MSIPDMPDHDAWQHLQLHVNTLYYDRSTGPMTVMTYLVPPSACLQDFNAIFYSFLDQIPSSMLKYDHFETQPYII